MSDRRKLPKRKKEAEASEQNAKLIQDDKPTPVEYEVAKYLRNKLPEKKTTLLGVWVDYFIASKAIDCLLDSKWATRPAGSTQDALFTTRESVTEFLDTMLHHKFFHRAKKIIVKEKKKIIKNKDNGEEPETKEATKETTKETAKEIKEVDTKESEGKDVKEVKEKKSKKEGKEKKKVKLDMHMEQVVIDANEPYVWIYEPLSIKSCVFGFLLVFGVVAVCLFPLWPSAIRNWVYYLSVAVASFLVFIISLALVKLIIFVFIWCITFGNHYFWIFPNLTEDVGFFESFWPLYEHKKSGSSQQSTTEKEANKTESAADLSKEKKKKKKQPKASAVEEEQGDGEEEENYQSTEMDPLLPGQEENFDVQQDGEEEEQEEGGDEENESSSSENDSLKNNGFEIVDNKDVPEILNLKL